MKNRIKKISIVVAAAILLFSGTMLMTEASEPVNIVEETIEEVIGEDIHLDDADSILAWIDENIPEDLNELPAMPQEWWDSLLPNQRRVAENLVWPAMNAGEYAVNPAEYVPQTGDQVAKMSLSSTGITDGYGKTLWKITNGGSNVFCLEHGKSLKKSYHYGNFRKMSGDVAFLIQNYGQSSTVDGYIAIQMAIWALQSASTEAEAYSYAYTWYRKSYNDTDAATWATTSMQFYRLAKGKSGTVWVADGPSGSQRVGKYQEFATSSYTGSTGGEGEGGEEPEPVEPEFDTIEDSVTVSYKVNLTKADYQTAVGLKNCVVDIYENGSKVSTVTTDSNGKASYSTSKSDSFSAEYCTNYDELTTQQQAEIDCFTSQEEAEEYIESEIDDFKEKKYTYSCREVTAPFGYVWQANEKSDRIAGNKTANLSITNERTLGEVEIIKYDTETESAITQGDAKTLDGAVYGIYASEDIIHQDQKTGVLFKKDELVQSASVTSGKILFEKLELGKYYIKEISPAEGYMLDETVYEATFTYKDQMVKIEKRDESAKDADNTLRIDDESLSKNVYSGDYVIKQGIQFIKTSDNAYQTELRPIEGAGFSVYLISDLSRVKSGELTPVNERWGTDDIMTFYEYDFTGEPKAVLYKRDCETWTKGDRLCLKQVSGDKYEVREMITDANGYIETPELPFGTYVIVETTTPENHVNAKPFIVYITQDGGVIYKDDTKQIIEKTYSFEESIRYGDRKMTKEREGRQLQKQRIINNTITKTFVRLVKADEEFLIQPGNYIRPEEVVRGTVLKKGAKYRLRCQSMEISEESLIAMNWKYDLQGYLSYYDPNEKKLTGTAANPFVTTFLEDDEKLKDCYVTLPQELPIGTYEIIEVTAPSGYVLNGWEQAVLDVSNDKENGYEIMDLTKERVVFTIGNGSVYPDGQMGLNKYALRDQYGNLTVTVLQKNQEQKGIVEIYKHGEQLAGMTGEKHFFYEDAPVEGAKFQIIAEENIYTQEIEPALFEQYDVEVEEYLLHKKGELIAEITTDKNGWAYAANLFIGKYKIVEVAAGDGFILNRTEEIFEVTPQEQKISFDIHFADYKNERQRLEISVKKTDIDTKEVLAGAVFGLYTAEDIYTNIEYLEVDDKWVVRDLPALVEEKDTLIAIATSNEQGIAVFVEEIPLGKYYVKELKAPKQYLLNEKMEEIDGSYAGQEVELQSHQLEFENKKETKVEVEKSTTSTTVKPGQFYEYTINTIKNLTEQPLEQFTMTDFLPTYVYLKELWTGTYNQELIYSIEYKTNLSEEWIIWQEDMNTLSEYHLVIPENLKENEFITTFRFCFGTVGGNFSQEILPRYRVHVKEYAEGKLHNVITLEALLEGETVTDKDETDTPVELPKPEKPSSPKEETPSDEDEEKEEPEESGEIKVTPGADTGDDASVILWTCLIIISIFSCYYIGKNMKNS